MSGSPTARDNVEAAASYIDKAASIIRAERGKMPLIDGRRGPVGDRLFDITSELWDRADEVRSLALRFK